MLTACTHDPRSPSTIASSQNMHSSPTGVGPCSSTLHRSLGQGSPKNVSCVSATFDPVPLEAADRAVLLAHRRDVADVAGVDTEDAVDQPEDAHPGGAVLLHVDL